MAVTFKKAARQRKPVKILLTGASHSGKTLSALLLAKGMGKRIGVIDSEHGGSTFYQGRFGLEFDILELDDFSDDSYKAAIDEGVKHYDVLIVDSLTHEWEWMKDYVDKLQSRGVNNFQAWAKATPRQQAFIEHILKAPVHVICTARSKTEWVIEDDGGKKTVKKLGTTPNLRSGTEFEFDIILDLAVQNHAAHVDKDRTGLLDGKIFVPSPEWGESILAWMQQGEAPEPKVEKPTISYVEPGKVLGAIQAFVDLGATEEEVRFELAKAAGVDELDPEQVTQEQFKSIRKLYKEVAAKEPVKADA